MQLASHACTQSQPFSRVLAAGVYVFQGNPFEQKGPLIVSSKTLEPLVDGVPVHTECESVHCRCCLSVFMWGGGLLVCHTPRENMGTWFRFSDKRTVVTRVKRGYKELGTCGVPSTCTEIGFQNFCTAPYAFSSSVGPRGCGNSIPAAFVVFQFMSLIERFRVLAE